MNKDKKTLYILSGLCLAFSLIILLCFSGGTQITAIAIAAAAFCAASLYFIRKRTAPRKEKGQVALIMGVSGLLAVVLFYLSGLYFGFSKVLLLSSFVYKYIIPYVLIIVATEIFRRRMLMQNDRLCTVLTYFVCLTADYIMLSRAGKFSDFSSIALALFPAVTGNFLYHSISEHYGSLPNILYRGILQLYPFLIPAAANLPAIMLSFLRLILPILVLGFIHLLYERRKFIVSRKKMALRYGADLALVLVAVAFVMLLSGRFRYGLLVIGSESMSGTADKGDAVVYEQYDAEVVPVGQVIVFIKDKTTVVHRVVDVQNIDGEVRYYTKGDANSSADSGYITSAQIYGKVIMKVQYVGYPTIWFRRLFK